jgi:zinc transport system ATP-binding protein
MTDDLLTIRDVRVHYGDKAILNGVNAGVARGKITALVGLNGSGKTTLLRAILKEAPYSGRIEFHCGHDHSRPTPEHVGYVPQKLSVEATLPLTVADLLALTLQRRPLFLGISRATRHRMEQMLEGIGLIPDILDRFVSKVSGGELQRVLLALALYPQPELLLLDEPAAGVDFQYQEKLYDLLTRINRTTGVTVLLVSHDTSVVSSMSDHVLCMKDGRIQCEGPPSQVMTDENLRAVFGYDKVVYTHHHPHG